MKKATTLVKQINNLLWELPNYSATEICLACSNLSDKWHMELGNIFEGFFSTMMEDEIKKKFPNADIGMEDGLTVYFTDNNIDYFAKYNNGKIVFEKTE